MRSLRSWIVAGVVCSLCLGPAGCASSGSDQQDVSEAKPLTVEEADFLFWYRDMISQTDTHPQYRRIPINSPSQQKRFNQLIEAAYFGQITNEEFVRTASDWYPDYETSIRIIAGYIPTPAEQEQIRQDEKAVDGKGR